MRLYTIFAISALLFTLSHEPILWGCEYVEMATLPIELIDPTREITAEDLLNHFRFYEIKQLCCFAIYSVEFCVMFDE